MKIKLSEGADCLFVRCDHGVTFAPLPHSYSEWRIILMKELPIQSGIRIDFDISILGGNAYGYGIFDGRNIIGQQSLHVLPQTPTE